MELTVTVKRMADEGGLDFLELENSFRVEGLEITFTRKSGWDVDVNPPGVYGLESTIISRDFAVQIAATVGPVLGTVLGLGS